MKDRKDPNEKKYVEQLTWLRGLAAFFVIVSHSIRATEQRYTPLDSIANNTNLAFLDLGSFGVVLFFVLSGCTLYISNFDRIFAGGISGFYIKRVFRIWPAFVVSLLVYIAFSSLFANFYIEPIGNWIERQYLADYSLADVFSYLTLTFNYTGPWGLFNNAYWSLPVEFQYYLIFPLIVASLKLKWLFGPLLISLVLYFFPKFGLFEFDSNKVFYLAFTFCGGVVAGWLYMRYRVRVPAIISVPGIVAMVVFVSAITNGYIKFPNVMIISNLWNWHGVLAILTVYLVLTTEFRFHNRLELFLKHYGTISYSTYLYHNLFIAITVLALIHFEIHDGWMRLHLTFFITLVVTYPVSALSYKYVEQPFIRIGRKVANSLFRGDSARWCGYL